MKINYKYIICACVVVLLLTVGRISTQRPNKKWGIDKHEPLECVIALKGHSTRDVKFSTGLHYEFLTKSQNILGHEVFIRLADTSENVIDSLKYGRIDLAVIPARDSAGIAEYEGLHCSKMFPDSTLWVSGENGSLEGHRLGLLTMRLFAMDDFERTVKRFSPDYEPLSRARRGYKYQDASPYDDLFKEFAKPLGWDWRLLAAIVWQESRFRIEARSSRGAEGLMQVMPATASRFNAQDELLDPVRNLESGTGYLKRLKKMFAEDAESEEELTRITLAAYNAGEGRLKELILYAGAMELPNKKWSDLEAVIPHLRGGDVMLADSVKISAFMGYETIKYVSMIDSLYRAFCVIAP